MEDVASLNERSKEILEAVVLSYIGTGGPIGSRTISRKYRMNISPATIRNIMSDLEERGYLAHPHTSAGRVPTDLGYRYFVDNLMNTVGLNRQEKRDVLRRLFPFRKYTNELLKEAADTLADFLQSMGVAVFPEFTCYTFKNFQFSLIRNKQILAILITNSGFVIDKVIEVDEDFSQNELDNISRFANLEFHNFTLIEIRQKICKLMSEQQKLYDEIVNKSLNLCTDIFSKMEVKDNQLIVNIDNLINNPNFSDVHELRQTLHTFEDKNRLLDVLSKCIFNKKGSVNISIGAEMPQPGFEKFSLVTSAYGYENQVLGSLGILGPKRMNYSKTVSLVRFMAELISDQLSGESENLDKEIE
jgi:heat-inducible transcriptional repressor